MTPEREKWDRIYAAHSSNELDPHIESFNTELLGAVQTMLPAGATVCELGCGAAWQSLALARSGRYAVSCLDFSEIALDAARQVFAHHGQKADFRNENGLVPGRPEFDLVFNCGVLEHYTFEQQVSFVKGMVSRSQRYVLAVVPNSKCYWYWVWRLHVCAKGAWPYGKEVPRCDIKDVFDAAGLNFAGVRYMAGDWTEMFVAQTIEDPAVREAVLRVHRAAPVGAETKSYLVAALGVVPGQDAGWLADLGWKKTQGTLDFTRDELATALVDSVAESLFLQSQLGELTRRIGASDNHSALEAAAAQLTLDIQRQAAVIGDLKSAIETATTQANSQINGQANLIGEVKSAIETGASEHHSALLAGIAQLHMEMRDQTALIAGVKSALDAHRREDALAELERHRTSLRRSDALLAAALARERKLLAEREEQVREFEKALAPLESQIATQKTSLDSEKQARADAEMRTEQTLVELEEERSSHRRSRELLQVSEMRSAARIAELNTALEAERHSHLAAIATLENERTSRVESEALLQASLQEQRGAREHLLRQLQQCAADKAEIKESLENRLQRTQTRLNHCLHELDTVRRHREILEQDLDSTRGAMHSANDALAAARQRLVALESHPAQGLARRSLHGALTGLQKITPEFMRAAVRKQYLNYFYYRIYPEKKPAAALPPPAPVLAAQTNGILAHSGYVPFVTFKARLCGLLPHDFRDVMSHHHGGRVSVVLPVYNGAAYIRESIDSVLAQTYPDFELIIVDDGSTDSTSEILQSYTGDARVRVVRQTNQKLPAALTNGFAQATGEFYTWTSADNIMLPSYLAELVQFLQEHQTVEMVYADEEIIDDEGRPLENSDFCPGYQTPPGSNIICWPSDPGELNFVQNNYIGGCFLYRAWAAKIVGDYVRDTFGFEDYDYWMRMNALFRVAHLGKRQPLYRYRLHSESLSARDGELRITERVREFMQHEEERRSWLLQPLDVVLAGTHGWNDALANLYENAGYNVFRLEDFSSDTLYRLKVTRAHRKSLAVLNGADGPNQVTEQLAAIRSVQNTHSVLILDGSVIGDCTDDFLGRFDWLVATDDSAWSRISSSFGRHALRAGTAGSVAYPLVAVANRLSWDARSVRPMSQAAGQ